MFDLVLKIKIFPMQLVSLKQKTEKDLLLPLFSCLLVWGGNRGVEHSVGEGVPKVGKLK